MPNATVTVRELKNRETGLDLSVTSHHVIPGLLTSTVEYQVMVVSRLQCFKSPRHKESDIVQYSIQRQLSDFEELRNKLGSKYHGTVLPPLPKRSIMGSETAISEKRNTLDSFVSLVAKTPKLASCDVTLQFLGVNPATAGKQKPVSEENKQTPDVPKEGNETKSSTQPASNLFDEEDNEEEDLLFGPPQKKDLFTDLSPEDYELFSSKVPAKSSQLFEAQDYGEAVDKNGDLFLPKEAFTDTDASARLDLEDNTELLTIEDDVEKELFGERSEVEKARSASMTEDAEMKGSEQVSNTTHPSSEMAVDSVSTPVGPTEKPKVPGDKPIVPGTKPDVPKCKPAVPKSKPPVPSSKPAVPGSKPVLPSKPSAAGSKPVVPNKPSVSIDKPSTPARKPPVPAKKPVVVSEKSEQSSSGETSGNKSDTDADKQSGQEKRNSSHSESSQIDSHDEKKNIDSDLIFSETKEKDVTKLDAADIMSYIEENTSQSDASLDLFS